jgi:hypothetical protein
MLCGASWFMKEGFWRAKDSPRPVGNARSVPGYKKAFGGQQHSPVGSPPCVMLVRCDCGVSVCATSMCTECEPAADAEHGVRWWVLLL